MAKVFKTQSFNADPEIMDIFGKLKKYRMVKNQFITEAIKLHYAKQIEPFELVWNKKKSDKPF